MKILIYWDVFLFYHFGRLSELFSLVEKQDYRIIPVSINPLNIHPDLSRYHPRLLEQIITLSEDVSANSMNLLSNVRKLLKLLNNISPDVVVIPGYDSLLNITALIWCRLHHKAAVLLSDSQEKDLHRSLIKEKIKSYLVSNFDAGFVAGENALKYLNKLGMPKERILAGVDVVDNDFWSEVAQYAKENHQQQREKINAPVNYFLAVCRLIPKKNIEGLLLAYASYVEAVPNPWDLIIIGDGVLAGRLKSLAHTLKLEQRVHIKGYLSPNELASYYGLASAFILPSSQFEQWGLVVNEAMAAGLPVLVSDVCGCAPDLVINGITGYSFSPFDSSGFLNCLVEMGSNLEKNIEMGKAAQAHIQSYSLTRFAENFLNISRIALQYSKKRRGSIYT